MPRYSLELEKRTGEITIHYDFNSIEEIYDYVTLLEPKSYWSFKINIY